VVVVALLLVQQSMDKQAAAARPRLILQFKMGVNHQPRLLADVEEPA
jgi:hypothetical protein